MVESNQILTNLSQSTFYSIPFLKKEPKQFSFDCEANRLMLRKRRRAKDGAGVIYSKSLSGELRPPGSGSNERGAPAEASGSKPRRARAATMVGFCKNVAAASKRFGAQMTPSIAQSARKRFFASDVEGDAQSDAKSSQQPTKASIPSDKAESPRRSQFIASRVHVQTFSKITRALTTLAPGSGAKETASTASAESKESKESDTTVTSLPNDQQISLPTLRVPEIATNFVKLAGTHTQAVVRSSAKSARIVTKSAKTATKSAVHGTVVSANAAQSAFLTAANATAALVQVQRQVSAEVTVIEIRPPCKGGPRPMLERRRAVRRVPKSIMAPRRRRRALFMF